MVIFIQLICNMIFYKTKFNNTQSRVKKKNDVFKLVEIITYLSIQSNNRFIFLIILMFLLLILTICISSLFYDISYN